MIQYEDHPYRYRVAFNEQTGVYVRTSVLDDAGIQTDEEPFRGSYPHLLDIGIMGHCQHGLSGRCLVSGVECYQNGRDVNVPHMTLEDFKRIIDESSGRTFQVALGGRGDPDTHPDFLEMIAYCRSRSIVPNFTTSGYQLDPKLLPEIRRYCGAAAVSWYRSPYTLKAIELLLAHGIRTNIHYVLNNETLDEAIAMMTENRIPSGVNRIIFLLHKPVGLGRKENVLDAADPKVKAFFGLFNEERHCNRSGFDSCSAPALINFAGEILPASYDTCEGARFSAYVSPDFSLYPCSFDQAGRYAVPLRDTSLEAAWNSGAFESFRNQIRNNCSGCEQESLCKGGCPLMREIVLCRKPEKHFEREALL